MDLHPDFKELLAECVGAKLEFVILGGYAVGFHARPRATKDLDLLVVGAPENLARLATALAAFGAPPNVVAAARTVQADDVIYFGVAPLRVDIMTHADGIDTRASRAPYPASRPERRAVGSARFSGNFPRTQPTGGA